MEIPQRESEAEKNKRKMLSSRRNYRRRKYEHKHQKKKKTNQIIIHNVWSVILYGCQTWLINKKEKEMSEALNMWYRRKM